MAELTYGGAMSASRLLPRVLTALLIIALSLGSVGTVVAATDPPHASFSVAVSGLQATFSDNTTGDPTAWAWDFGDGATSEAQNPIHTYPPGDYTVTLTATNDGGSDRATRDITIDVPPPARTRTASLYSSLVRYQNPDLTACVGAATLIMLNQVATRGSKGDGFKWVPSTELATQRSIIKWARAHDTLEPGPGGTDPNGWRNALNQYGWDDYQDPVTMTYQVFSYSSYGAAVKNAVIAMARYHRPVGILGWAGGHAQVLNGYTVFGQDPEVSTDFKVQYVYLTDPLKRDAMRNARISYTKLIHGPLKYRLRKYRQKDSPLDDPYTEGFLVADKAWYGRYVIVAPVR
ncbi:MAG: PKD domain-containing protein [Candidatus Limnocylindrales bacterium]